MSRYRCTSKNLLGSLGVVKFAFESLQRIEMSTHQANLPNAPREQQPDLRKRVDAAFESVSGVIKAAAAPLPTQTGDGSSIQTAKATGVLQDIFHMHPRDIITLAELAKDAATHDPMDDKSFLMERLIKLASELPLTSKDGNLINDKFVQQLYDDLEHPPTKILGEDHRFRAADGSYNVRSLAMRSWKRCQDLAFQIVRVAL